MASDAERDYWEAVASKIGERCDFYSAEDLAAFVEGNVRGRNARALEAHLRDCAECRGVVEELQRELDPQLAAVRVRLAPARGWVWALAAGFVATVLIVAVVLRPGGRAPQAPIPGIGPGPSPNVAELPSKGGERPSPVVSEAPSAVTGTPREPGPEGPLVPRHPGRHARPPAAERTAPPATGIINDLPSTTAFAFAEPLDTHPATAAEVEELLRQGAVNDLPEEAAAPLDHALVDEFYQGFDELVQDLRTRSEVAAQ